MLYGLYAVRSVRCTVCVLYGLYAVRSVFHVKISVLRSSRPVRAVGCVDCFNTINEPPRSGKRELLDKIITVYVKCTCLCRKERAVETTVTNDQ